MSDKKVDKKKGLWIISELYYPEETSTGYYLTRIAEGLAEDYEVKVVCGQPNYAARGIKAPKREYHKNVEIFRAFGTTLDKNKILFRLLNMISLSWSIFFKAVKNFRKGNSVLVVTTPPVLPFITAAASLLKGTRYILLIHDNYPEILVAAGKISEKSFFVRIWHIFNRWLYKYASKIIVVGRDMRQLVEKKTAGLEIPIEFIPNWAELETVEPQPRESNELLRDLNITAQIVFLYAGNMGYPNDIESIVDCAEKLREDKRFCFIFLGSGVKRKWLVGKVLEKGLQNIKILDPRPREDQKIFLNACDIGIVTLVKKMWGVSMPSRTYNILAAGKPILALTEKQTEIAQVIEDDSVGWIVPPNQPAELLAKILEIFGNQTAFEEMGKNARKSAVEKYSLEKAIERYHKALSIK